MTNTPRTTSNTSGFAYAANTPFAAMLFEHDLVAFPSYDRLYMFAAGGNSAPKFLHHSLRNFRAQYRIFLHQMQLC